jgi:DNA mismatch repair ATPase MutS
LRLTPLAVGASLRTQDSLLDGRSRFMAELQQLERIVRVARSGEPLLFLIDELLSGTNSHDRRIGAQALALELWQRGAIGLLTTHDLAITGTVAAMQGEARNVHFVDHLEAGAMQFDYRLHDGVVTKSNALALMRLVGLLPPEDQRPLDP